MYITVAIIILLLVSFVFCWFRARTMEDLKSSQLEVLDNTSTVFQSQLDAFSWQPTSSMPHLLLRFCWQIPKIPSLLSLIFPSWDSPLWLAMI